VIEVNIQELIVGAILYWNQRTGKITM
jgi:hypothetical protein